VHWLTLLPLLLVTEPTIPVPVIPTPACVACSVDAEQVRSDYSKADWKDLALGHVVTTKADMAATDGGIKTSVQTSAIIPRTPAQVWSVLVDFDSRPEFTPGLKESHTRKVEGERVWLDERVRVWWINVRYHIIDTLEPDRGVISWVLDKSRDNDIKDSFGSWQLVPLPPGPQTLVRYRAHIDTGQPVPGFIETFLVKRSLPTLVRNLRDEVERRYPQE
jgi:ribosome-associated toxin RatA of RatAB toxin-antitoxin module